MRHAETYRGGKLFGCICPSIFLALQPLPEHRRRALAIRIALDKRDGKA